MNKIKKWISELTAVGRISLLAAIVLGGMFTVSAISPSPATTRSVSNCDPNYSGCVPIASDVDCSGGSGNGPAYVTGPVKVIGRDIYDLDRDGNGWGCE